MVIGEDDVLLREGIARLLTEAGFDVVAQAGDAEDLLRKGLAHRPSVVIADVKMPPGHGDDGLRAAIELRRQRPETGVLVLSQYYEEHYALELIGDRAEGVGYLLKERVGDVESFIDAVTRVAAGGSALDPEVVGRMLGRRQRDRPLDRLSPRERDVLAAMAEGKSNHGIARAAVRQPGRGGEARHEHLPQARARSGPDRAPARARRPRLPARRAERLILDGDRHERAHARASALRTLQEELPTQRRHPILEAAQAGVVATARAPDAIIANLDPELSTLNAGSNCGAICVRVLDHVRQRFADHEISGRLDTGGEALDSYLDG